MGVWGGKYLRGNVTVDHRGDAAAIMAALYANELNA
jgi:hypothetical protein